VITIGLPWDSLPLRSNDRHHRMAKWRIEQDVKTAARVLAAQFVSVNRYVYRFPIDFPVTVTLVWMVTTNHRRDAGAGSATLKPFLDGLVAGGLILDDRHTIVTRESYEVEVGARKGVRVEIRSVTE
jgi:hypothetical protein